MNDVDNYPYSCLWSSDSVILPRGRDHREVKSWMSVSKSLFSRAHNFFREESFTSFLGHIPLVLVFRGHGGRRRDGGSHVSECRCHMLCMPSRKASPETRLFLVCGRHVQQSLQFAHCMYSQQCWPSSAFSHIPTPYLTEPKFSKFWNFKPSVYQNSPYSTVVILPEGT